MTREEAIEVVKKNWPDSKYTSLREALETLIPELRESEDEMIRRGIIQTLEFACAHKLVGVDDVLKMKAYLEKQKEQKPANFPATDEEMKDFLDKTPPVEVPEKYKTADWLFDKMRQKPAEWSEEDENTYKWVYNLFERSNDKWFECVFAGCYPKVKRESVLAWLKSLRPQPKQEWSEEDRDKVAQYLHDKDEGMLWSKATGITRDILNMLRPRPSWKPTEEQMKALQNAVALAAGNKALAQLYEQLKAIKKDGQ